MINKVTLKNFKCFENMTIDCKELTLFTGINGMGKSTVIQAVLLLRQNYESNLNLTDRKLLLNGRYVSLGTQRDILYWYRADDEIQIKIEDEKEVWDFSYDSEGYLLSFEYSGFRSKPSFLADNLEYISAERLGPRRYYDNLEREDFSAGQIGIKGENTAACLYEEGSDLKIYPNMKHGSEQSERLDMQINAWMSEISPGIKVNAIPYLDVNLMGIRYSTSNSLGEESTNALNMGFGVSYCLPVIVSLLKAKKGDLLILENPEAHLHPRGQRRIGELVALAAANGVQIFLETHSDHVLNGIRLAVRKKKIECDRVKINYFYEFLTDQGIPRHEKTSPEILPDGSLSNWPDGFFDEWDKAVDEFFEEEV